MIIILLPIMIFYICKNEILKLDKKWMFYLVFTVYILFFLYYVKYINNFFGLGPGLTQADAYWHYRGAEEISKGASWVSLSTLSARFERIGINTIGYFLYIEFLSLCCFKPAILPVEWNIYLFYIFQILLSIDVSIRLTNAITTLTSFKRKSTLFLIISLCAPYMTQSYQLMRDIYYMWFAAIAFEIVISNTSIASVSRRGKWILSVSVLMAVLLRYYIIVLLIPVIFYYSVGKKVGQIYNYAIFLLLTLGVSLIIVIKNQLGMNWDFGNVSIGEFLNFLMFPNFFNQTKILMNFKFYFPRIDVSGSNVPGVYYIMSLWNLYVFPLAIIGIFSEIKLKLHKSKIKEIFFWIILLINNVLVYCVAYDEIDNRLKLFMTVPLIFFVSKGCSKIANANKYSLPIYSTVICIVAIMTTLFYA